MSFNDRTISFSEFRVHSECPKHHKLSYIEKRDNEEGTVHNTKWEWAAPFGTGAHEGVQAVIAGASISEGNVLFRRTFIEESRKRCVNPHGTNPNKKLLGAGKYIIQEALDGFNKYFGKGKWEFVANEYQLMVPLQGHLKSDAFDDFKFKGFIDTVVRMTEDHMTPDGDMLIAGTYIIIDQKTCGWGWPGKKKGDYWIQAQLMLYRYFYSVDMDIPFRDIKCFFMLMKRDPGKKHPIEIFQVKFTRRKVDNLLVKLGKALATMRRGFAPPLGKSGWNDSACFFCPFKQTKFCK